MAQATGIRATDPHCAAIGASTHAHDFSAVVFYRIAAHLHTMAARELDAARRRRLERCARAVLQKAREVLRAAPCDGGRR